MTGWSDLLDELEERVRRLESPTRGDGPPLGTSPVWEVDGPLPVELAPRAHALLARSRVAEAQVAAALRRKRAELSHIQRQLPPTSKRTQQ